MSQPRLLWERGWAGWFSREEYPGAMPNGTRVAKVNTEPGDSFTDGTQGTVLGSVGHPEEGLGYFVEWDPAPRNAVFIHAHRVRRA